MKFKLSLCFCVHPLPLTTHFSWEKSTPICCMFLFHFNSLSLVRHFSTFIPFFKRMSFANNHLGQCVSFVGRNYGTGPFATFEHSPEAVSKFLQSKGFATTLAATPWAGLAFSPDETHLLVTSESGLLLLLDAFDGNLLHAFDSTAIETEEGAASSLTVSSSAAASAVAAPAPVTSAEGSSAAVNVGAAATSAAAAAPGACFTPDGKFVVFGTQGGEVCAWAVPPAPPSPDVQGGDSNDKTQQLGAAAKDDAAINAPAVRLRGHVSGVSCVACSPAYGVLASACSVIALWTPKEDGNEIEESKSSDAPESNAMEN